VVLLVSPPRGKGTHQLTTSVMHAWIRTYISEKTYTDRKR